MRRLNAIQRCCWERFEATRIDNFVDELVILLNNGPPLAGHGAEAVCKAMLSMAKLPKQLRQSLT